MESMKKLMFLLNGSAAEFRIHSAARVVLAKVIMTLPVDENSRHLIALRDTI